MAGPPMEQTQIPNSKFRCSLCFLCLFVVAGDGIASEPVNLDTIRKTLRAAGDAYREENYAAAKASLETAGQQLDALNQGDLNQDAEVRKAAIALRKSWSKANRLVASKLKQSEAKQADTRAISFTAELASEIVERCIGCHGENRARQDLRLHTFAGLLKGSENGAVLVARDAAESLIVRKLRGEADGDRMPPNGRPMSNEWIAKFEQWIREGAKFDGQDSAATLKQEILSMRRSQLSADELTTAAEEVARKNWKLAFPEREAKMFRSGRLLVVADGPEEYARLGEQTQVTLVDVLKILGLPKDAQLKGVLTIYIIPRQYDFAEWTRMVEKRSSPGVTDMHWRSDGGLGYAVLGPNSLSDKNQVTDESRLTQVLTSAVLSQWGAPAWYADGRGLLTYGRTNRRDTRLRRWRSLAASILPKITTADDIMTAQLPADQADAATWAFASFLGADRRRATQLHTALQNGQAFDVAFLKYYDKPASELCNAWLKTFQRANKKRR